MRTAHYKKPHGQASYIESGPARREIGAPTCSFCNRPNPKNVRRIVFSGNGFQSYVWEICDHCRPVLRLHLSDNPNMGERVYPKMGE